MKEFWNQRYDIDEFVYGENPSHFFGERLWDQKFGRLLLPGEGEGRNAVYAAKKGWFVHAFDYSNVAAAKAIKFSRKEQVRFEYQIADVRNFKTAEDFYHLIAIAFLHLPPEERICFHKEMIKSLKPGGTIIAEYFSKKQIDLNSGGPKNIDMLYDESELREDFKSLNILEIEEKLVEQEGGKVHDGEAWVIQLVGKKAE
ncbi:MAG: class I SAM-dependent methyltransferase [Bacteroidota bacterium]